jgi:hypothetical protein
MLGWFRKLLWRQSYRAYPISRSMIRYVEQGRKMDIAGEMLSDGFAIYVSSIVAWNDSRGELISDLERERIKNNVQCSLERLGMRVYLD